MTKFKKTISRVLCGLSAFVFMFSALFYPLESFKADVNGQVYISPDLLPSDISLLGPTSSNVSTLADGSFYYSVISDNYLFKDSSGNRVSIPYGYVRVVVNLYGKPNNTYSGDLNFTCSNIVKVAYMGQEFLLAEAPDVANFYTCSFYCKAGETGDRISIIVDFFGTYFDNSSSTSKFTSKFDVTSLVVRVTSITPSDEVLLDEISDSLAILESDNDTIISYLNSIKSSTASTVTKLNSLITYTQELIDSVDELTVEMQELQSLVNITNSYLAEIEAELETQTTWLERIWNTIVDIFDASDEQEDKVDSFNSESKEQSDNINGMVGSMNSVDKPQANPDSIDQFIPSSDSFVIVALDSVMGFGPVTNSILCVMLMALVAYVLFGKR